MNRKEFMTTCFSDYMADKKLTMENIIEFFYDDCFCDNCEHNAPNYPWDKK